MDSSRQGEIGSSMPGQESTTTGSSMPQTVGGPEGTGASQTSAGDAGSAAVGSTSTYSSHHLTKGDPTSGVIDHQSQDPATFQTPERSGATGATGAGVPSGAATTAASTAFNNGKEREGESKAHTER